MAYYESQKTKYDIPLNHLDHAYIPKCTDVKELEKILKVLRSGSEGTYPDLEKLAEKQLEKLSPDNKLLRKSEKPLQLNDLGEEEKKELQDYIEDWVEGSKEKEKKLSRNIDNMDHDLPPVRNAATGISADRNPEKLSDLKNSTQKRVKPREYREWDRFDVDAELNRIEDQNVSENTESQKAKSKKPELSESIDSSGLSDELKRTKADYERNKGNEAFKAGDLDEAITYYARSISLHPTAAAFNNRALIHLRRKSWNKALDDCNTVLKMEPENLKAVFRRASAYQGLTRYPLARTDLEHVLSKEPNNKNALTLLKEVDKTLVDQKVSGRRLKIEEVEEPSALREDDNEEQKPDKSRISGVSVTDQNEEKISSEEIASEKDTQSGSAANNDTDKKINQVLVSESISKRGCGDPEAENSGDADSVTKIQETKSSISNSSVLNGEVASNLPPPPLEKDVVVLKDVGNDLFRRGQYSDALQKYNAAIDKIPEGERLKHAVNLSVLYGNRAACKLKVGDCRGCVDDCNEAILLFPNSAKPYFRRAMAYEQMEKYKEAYVDYKQAINAGINNDAASKGSDRCASVLQQLNGPQWREKLPKIASFSSLSSLAAPSPSVSEHTVSATDVVQSDDSEKLFERHKTEGNKLFAKGEFLEAIECFTKCIELFSDRVVPYTNRALCYLKLGKCNEVLSDCNQALSIEFHNVKALYRRALAYKMLEKFEECLIDLETLLKLDPNNSAAKKELQVITKHKEEKQEKKAQVACLLEQQKLRHRMKIKEVDGSSDNEEELRQNSPKKSSQSRSSLQGTSPKPVSETGASSCQSSAIKLDKITPYTFFQAWKCTKSLEDIQSRVVLIDQVEPEELPHVISSNLNGGFIIDLLRCFKCFVQSGRAARALEYLLYLPRATRFELEILFLSETDKDEVREMFDLLEERLKGEINVDHISQVRNKYEV